jgi:hypothetical protein
VEAKTPHKAVYSKDQEWYNTSISRWLDQTQPRVESFAKKLEVLLSDEELSRLGAVGAEFISWRNIEIKVDGTAGNKQENELYELRIPLKDLAAKNHSVEVEQFRIAFKTLPSPVKIIKLVERVTTSLSNFNTDFNKSDKNKLINSN